MSSPGAVPAAVQACIAFGGNQGEVIETFRQARRKLCDAAGIGVCSASWVYRTAPVGFLAQADFLNAVLALQTRLAPMALLALLLRIERQHGRLRGAERDGPRPLDLDLLLHGEAQLQTPALTLPHPRMTARAFVLAPLVDVLGADRLLDGDTLGGWLAQCSGQRVLRFAAPGDWS